MATCLYKVIVKAGQLLQFNLAVMQCAYYSTPTCSPKINSEKVFHICFRFLLVFIWLQRYMLFSIPIYVI